jgi:predicted DNA-binding ribbon-helix-helix protein
MKTIIANTNQTNLYETDFSSWLEETANLLKQGKLEKLDIENLIEEIEGMSRSEKDALESNLRVLLMHLLKWKYQSAKRSNSWLYTIREHRKRIQKTFNKSPSLKPYFDKVFAESYQDARELAADETGLDINLFPGDCPFSQADVINSDYLPE